MILLNIWHLVLLLCICLAIISVAAYAKAINNFKKIFKQNIVIGLSMLVLCFGFMPNTNLFATYNINSNLENTVQHNNTEPKQNSFYKLGKIATFIMEIAKKLH